VTVLHARAGRIAIVFPARWTLKRPAWIENGVPEFGRTTTTG